MALARTLEIRTSPHVLSGHDVDTIMFNVVLALVPALGFAIAAFGLAGLLVLATSVASCLAAEALGCRLAGRPSTLSDWSAVVTGVLYGLTLPPSLPLWMVALGGFASIALGKLLFGGLGANPFNPALVGRALLQAAFPVAMTSWIPAFAPDRLATLPASTLALPFSRPVLDGITGATPLAAFKFGGEATAVGDLALGFVGGSTGETSAILLLVGAAYLVARNMMSWRIPLAILGTVAALSAGLHALDARLCAGPGFMLFSGGLMLGALYMATDMVGSPMTHAGCLLYGALIGLLVVVIRVFGAMPEGVMYAILLGNATTPLIDTAIRPRVFGAAQRSRPG
jgi:electron transport complex protein RnfD